ncbi:hypothetical protein [Bradyrhizobium manausense]|nr:hypothetical protein [Bradyrhizobium manausense]
MASPIESSTGFAANFWRAVAICASEGSIAETDEGARVLIKILITCAR